MNEDGHEVGVRKPGEICVAIRWFSCATGTWKRITVTPPGKGGAPRVILAGWMKTGTSGM